LGVVGLGDRWERHYKPALLRMSEKFEIRAVFDEVAYRGRMQAMELECDAADGFTCLIERDDVDAVYVLGGTWLGLEPVLAACRASKAIFLGRFIGADSAGAGDVFQTVQASGVPFMIEFPWRFYPATNRLIELLSSGLGAPQLAFCEQHVFEPGKAGPSSVRHGMEFSDVMLHLADWLRFVFARDPESTQSIGGSVTNGPSRGFETLTVRFGESALGQATVRRFLQPQWTEAAAYRRAPAFQVVAQHGMAFLEMPGQITWFDQSGCHEEHHEPDRPVAEMLSDRFYQIIRHGLTPAPGLSDAMWARKMVFESRYDRATDVPTGNVAHRTAG
jgi:predicted dehydrogenase